MKKSLIGKGYYSLDRMNKRRDRLMNRITKLDGLIATTERAIEERGPSRKEKYTKRDRQIHKLRNKGYTLVEIGGRFGITKNRVSQIINHGNGHE